MLRCWKKWGRKRKAEGKGGGWQDRGTKNTERKLGLIKIRKTMNSVFSVSMNFRYHKRTWPILSKDQWYKMSLRRSTRQEAGLKMSLTGRWLWAIFLWRKAIFLCLQYKKKICDSTVFDLFRVLSLRYCYLLLSFDLISMLCINIIENETKQPVRGYRNWHQNRKRTQNPVIRHSILHPSLLPPQLPHHPNRRWSWLWRHQKKRWKIKRYCLIKWFSHQSFFPFSKIWSQWRDDVCTYSEISISSIIREQK